MENEKTTPSGMVLRWIVLGVGAILFVLLLLADKTNLTNRDKLDLDGGVVSAGPAQSAIALPDLQDTTYQALLRTLDSSQGSQRMSILDSLTTYLEKEGRPAYAAIHASELASLDSSFKSKLRAGVLSYKASREPIVLGDSVRFRQFSDLAMNYLEEAVEKESNNEEALFYLGVSYVESRLPQNAMRGIRTLTNVLEINPDNMEASYQLGVFSMQTGQFAKASARFLKVLELAPNNEEARLQLAFSYAQQGKTREAIQELDRIIAESTNEELKATARQLKSRF